MCKLKKITRFCFLSLHDVIGDLFPLVVEDDEEGGEENDDDDDDNDHSFWICGRGKIFRVNVGHPMRPDHRDGNNIFRIYVS